MNNKILFTHWKSSYKLPPNYTNHKLILLNDFKHNCDLHMKDCICGSTLFEDIVSSDVIGIPTFIVICKKCGLIQQNPRIDNLGFSRYYSIYSKDLYLSTKNSIETDDEFSRMVKKGEFLHSYVKKYLHDFDKSPKKVLDVGCNIGGTIFAFMQKSHICTGIDLNPFAADYANNKKINVQLKDLETFIQNNTMKFDFIIYNHVLEHISDIKKEMDLLKSLLTENGSIFIGVPNLSHGLNIHWDFQKTVLFQHIYYFCRETLRNCMQICGFFEVDCSISPIINNERG